MLLVYDIALYLCMNMCVHVGLVYFIYVEQWCFGANLIFERYPTLNNFHPADPFTGQSESAEVIHSTESKAQFVALSCSLVTLPVYYTLLKKSRDYPVNMRLGVISLMMQLNLDMLPWKWQERILQKSLPPRVVNSNKRGEHFY